MSFNLYTIIAYILILLIVIWRVRTGFKRGFAGELSNAFSMLAALGASYMLFGLVLDFLDGRFGSVLSGILYLAFVLFLYKLIHILFRALKLFTHLPVIKGLDKLLGAVLGLVEAALIVLALMKLVRYLLT